MLSSQFHAISIRGQSKNKVLRRKINLTLSDSRCLQVRALHVSPSGLTLMSPWRLLKGFVCKIEFDVLLDGQLRKVSALSKTQESVCVGMDGFRIDMTFLELNEQSRKNIQDLMDYGK